MYPYFSWKRLIFKCLGIPQSMCSSSLLSEPNESSVLEFLGVYLRRIPVQSVVWHIHLNPTLLVQFSGRKCGQFLVSEGLFERIESLLSIQLCLIIQRKGSSEKGLILKFFTRSVACLHACNKTRFFYRPPADMLFASIRKGWKSFFLRFSCANRVMVEIWYASSLGDRKFSGRPLTSKTPTYFSRALALVSFMAIIRWFPHFGDHSWFTRGRIWWISLLHYHTFNNVLIALSAWLYWAPIISSTTAWNTAYCTLRNETTAKRDFKRSSTLMIVIIFC